MLQYPNMLSLSATRLLLLRTRFLLFTITPALLPLGGLAFYAWLPEDLLKYFFFTKGWVAWTFAEYCWRRWGRLFRHAVHVPVNNPVGVLPAQALGLLTLGGSAWMLWSGPVWLTYGGGMACGAMLALHLHGWLHQPAAARWIPKLVRQHIWHHGKYPRRCFGISTGFWDRAFKTQVPADKLLPEQLVIDYYADKVLPAPELKKLTGMLQTGKKKTKESTPHHAAG